jgi:hypothetical protein
MSQPDPAPPPRLTSQERIALNLIASTAKPWNGQPADSIRAPLSVLQRLADRGLLRSSSDSPMPLAVREDTLIWITPAGRVALAKASP